MGSSRLRQLASTVQIPPQSFNSLVVDTFSCDAAFPPRTPGRMNQHILGKGQHAYFFSKELSMTWP